MPLPNIKSIKTFGRRKSAGNSTDEGSLIAAAPVSTFRVIPRDEANRKSIGGSQTLRLSSNNDYLPARQNSYEEEAKWSNRCVNGTFSLPAPSSLDHEKKKKKKRLTNLRQRQQQYRHLVSLARLRTRQHHSLQFLLHLTVSRRSDQEG